MNVTIYSTSTCVPCKVLTQWLDEQNVVYTKKITDEDPTAMAEFMNLNDGMISVPFTVITSKDGAVSKITGFDEARLQQILKG